MPLEMPTERLVKQFVEANAIARRILELSEIQLKIAYCFILRERLIIATDHDGCDEILEHEDRLMAIIRGFSAIPEIAALKFIQLDIFTLTERRIKHDLIPIDRESEGKAMSLGEITAEEKDALIQLLSLNEQDREILLRLLDKREGDSEALLIRMSDHTAIAAICDTFIWKKKKPVAEKVSPKMVKDRVCLPWWDAQDLEDYCRDIFQQGAIENYKWRSKGVDEDGNPTPYFLQQHGEVELLTFNGVPHRLVRIHESEPLVKGLKKRIYLGKSKTR